MAGEIIRPSDLTTERTSPVASEFMVVDNGVTVAKSKISDVVLAGRPTASQAEAEGGADPSKAMTPLTTKQAIIAQGDARFASIAQGAKADTAVQSIVGSSEIDVDDTDPLNPIISYVGAGVSDGDKGDLTVSSAGAVWDINAGVIVPPMLKDEDAKGFRMAANVRGRVNFFDLLQETRSSAVREQIMNGTFTGDLAVEWQAFRNALAAIDTAGGRPYGFIPECKIYSSVAPNFAMDYLTLDTQGHVRIEAIGPITGFLIDGMGLGANGYGVRHMNIGPLCASTATGTYGIRTRRAHMSDFRGFQSLGAGFAGINIDGCVTSNFHKPIVTNQAEPFIATPAIGMLATGTSGGDGSEPWHALIQTSWCKFDIPIMEWVPIGTVLEHTYGNTIMGGTSEGCSDIGLQLSQFAQYNKIFGHDLEVNTNYDLDVQGSFNDFFGCDIQTMALFRFGAHDNRIIGGHWGHVTFDSATQRNLITAANVNGITDNSTGADRNRVSNVTDGAGDWTDRWTLYAPTIGAAAGALGAGATAGGRYKLRDGDTIDFEIVLQIGANGTGSSAITSSLPFAPVANWSFSGMEIAATSRVVGAYSLGGTALSVFNADGSYPGGDNRQIVISGTYQRA